MNVVGLDIGTNYTKATKDGKNVTIFPSIVVFGEEKDWSLKGETRDVYIGEDALAIVQNLENIEVLRPLHEGRLIHDSYLELAKYALNRLEAKENLIIATGLPVKSSKKEREQLIKTLEENLSAKVLLFPEPVGTLAYMGVETGVCIDIGFGTTDTVVLSYMEYLKGDTMLIGVDKLYENLEITIRNKIGISLTPEEMTKLLTIENYEIGRVRSGKKISVSHEGIMGEYYELMKSWVDRISNRVKMLLEGVSTSIVENIVLTGGGSALPGVFEEFSKSFEEIVELKRPDDPLIANSKGYYMLAKTLAGEVETKELKEEKVEKVEETVEEKGEKKKKKGK
ncbi:rod shape-determining protein MreB [Archaeoglobales archaeon]|nr:MAG: rod shape-determining protein MreB [Archaeoglobales archaeon]